MSRDGEPALVPILHLVPAPTSVTPAISRFHRIWPVVALAFAVIINLAWIGFSDSSFSSSSSGAFFSYCRP